MPTTWHLPAEWDMQWPWIARTKIGVGELEAENVVEGLAGNPVRNSQALTSCRDRKNRKESGEERGRFKVCSKIKEWKLGDVAPSGVKFFLKNNVFIKKPNHIK